MDISKITKLQDLNAYFNATFADVGKVDGPVASAVSFKRGTDNPDVSDKHLLQQFAREVTAHVSRVCGMEPAATAIAAEIEPDLADDNGRRTVTGRFSFAKAVAKPAEKAKAA